MSIDTLINTIIIDSGGELIPDDYLAVAGLTSMDGDALDYYLRGTHPLPDVHDEFSFDQETDLLGAGSWKEVYKAKSRIDSSGWALKFLSVTPLALEQAKERGYTLEDIWRNETLGGWSNTATNNLAFSFLRVSSDGHIYQIEELLSPSVGEQLDEGARFTKEQKHRMLKDWASGLHTAHYEVTDKEGNKGRVLGDCSIYNNGFSKNGSLKITDHGASSAGQSKDKERGRIGKHFSRAPECTKEPVSFLDSKKPTKTSDVFMMGDNYFRTLSKDNEHLFQPILETIGVDIPLAEQKSIFEDYISTTENDALQKFIDKRIKEQIPKGYRKLLGRMLKVNSYERIRDGKELQGAVEETIRHLDAKSYLRDQARRHAMPVLKTLAITVPLGLMALYGIKKSNEYELKDVSRPQVIEVSYIGEAPKDQLLFTEEEHKKEDVPSGLAFKQDLRDYQFLKGNWNTFVLFQSYKDAITRHGWVKTPFITEAQAEYFSQYNTLTTGAGTAAQLYPSVAYLTIARNIEHGLAKAAIDSNTVDLEDAMVIARCGIRTYDRVMSRARQLAQQQGMELLGKNPFDYNTYREFTDAKGKPLISKSDRAMIDQWRAYTFLPDEAVVGRTPDRLADRR